MGKGQGTLLIGAVAGRKGYFESLQDKCEHEQLEIFDTRFIRCCKCRQEWSLIV